MAEMRYDVRILEGIIIKLPTFWNRLCVGITPYDALTCRLWRQLTRVWNRASVCFSLSFHLSFLCEYVCVCVCVCAHMFEKAGLIACG